MKSLYPRILQLFTDLCGRVPVDRVDVVDAAGEVLAEVPVSAISGHVTLESAAMVIAESVPVPRCAVRFFSGGRQAGMLLVELTADEWAGGAATRRIAGLVDEVVRALQSIETFMAEFVKSSSEHRPESATDRLRAEVDLRAATQKHLLADLDKISARMDKTLDRVQESAKKCFEEKETEDVRWLESLAFWNGIFGVVKREVYFQKKDDTLRVVAPGCAAIVLHRDGRYEFEDRPAPGDESDEGSKT